MPIDYRRYPATWKTLRLELLQRARMQCECTGECGLHQPNPNTRRCTERHHKPARWFRGLVRLTLAHTCTCDPPCDNPTHILVMCQRCHLRIDRALHVMHRHKT